MNLENLIKEFEKNANPTQAKFMEKYMKNKFLFFGIQAPKRKELWTPYFKEAKKTKSIDWNFIKYCWEYDKRECQYIAGYYLKTMQKFLVKEDLPKLKSLVVTKSWWDSVDILDRVIGSLISRYSELESVILEWSKDDNIWLRRVAIDHQLLRKENTNVDLLEKILINNLNHTEFFVNKAVGWALRDYSKTNPKWVKSFIEKYHKQMSNLSIKEAGKYL
ncbi:MULTISPECIES: DNA alkylation repair protein [Gemella]|uniref:DNA alkylation repair protein n=1 Tax=Gemella TaxID=1378 RepID=UPI000767EB06|nr:MULTISPECIES: DNA alkylation repair protein [Gemella]AME09202.1 DNA alkylation repair protein [Gemella sp. oral taxon 928]AXI26835.1 DNA alkylation repair protein [Gemella sp. ND 6198]